MEVGIYLHIPFCVQRCNYCDFVSNVAKEAEYEKYVVALYREIALYKKLFPDIIISTIYFGGGTPSLLKGEHIQGLLQEIKEKFYIKNNAEITIEANPGTMDEEKMLAWYKAGINRISIGVQTTRDYLLKKIGRIHSLADVNRNINMAKELGFNNLSVDLMYGLPEQTMEDLQASVQWALTIGIQHISIYGLQVEPNTVFGSLAEKGKLILPSEVYTEKMYDYIAEKLPEQGFKRYEISNYALAGYESKHNMSYWQDKWYLGIGAGAHGYISNERTENYRDLHQYMSSCEADMLPVKEKIIVTKQAHMEEVCFLSLRTSEGLKKKFFYDRFGKEIEFYYGEIIKKLIAKGLIIDTGETLVLTPLGMKFGNVVFQEFLL